MTSRIVRALIVTSSIIMANLVPATPAFAAPSSPGNWSYIRDGNADGVSVDVKSVETGAAVFSHGIDSTWPGWDRRAPKKYSFATETFSLSGADGIDGEAWPLWEARSSTNRRCYESGYGLTFSLPKTTCADTVTFSLVVFVYGITDDTTITSTIDDAAFTVNRDEVAESDGLVTTIRFDATVSEESSITVDTELIHEISADGEMCVDESLVDVGDDVVKNYNVAFDGTPIGESASDVEPWANFNGDDGATVTIDGVEPLQDVSEWGAVLIETPDVGEVTITVDFDLRKDGVSVLESCYPRHPTQLDTSDTGESPGATDTTVDLPSAVEFGDDNEPWAHSDGFGGQFYLSRANNPETDTTSATLAHIDSAGDSGGFAGDGSAEFELSSTEYVNDLSRWGSGGSNWLVTIHDWDTGDVTFVTGAMSNNTTESLSVSAESLADVCERDGAEFYELSVISAPTVQPLVNIRCTADLGKKKGTIVESVLAFVGFGQSYDLQLVSTLTPIHATPTNLSHSIVGVDPDATGSDTAVWVYNENLNAQAAKRVVFERITTAIEPNGSSVRHDVSGNPLGKSITDEITVVPGSTEGNWVGLVTKTKWNKRGEYAGTNKVFAVDENYRFTPLTPTDITPSTPINYFGVTALAANFNDRIAVVVSSGHYFDSAIRGSHTLNLIDATTGVVDEGETLDFDDLGSDDSVSTPGFDADNNPVLYWRFSENQLQIVTWSLPSPPL